MNFAIRNMFVVASFGIAAVGLAGPANAFQAPDHSANSAQSPTVQTNDSGAPATVTKHASAKKYCLTVEASTGTRMMTRECKTKAEWEMLGYELSETN